MIRSGFEPYRHGFNFTNGTFKFYVGPVGCNVLCGGMAYTALDYFHNKLRTPDLARPPAEGNPFFEYIYKRQSTAHFYTWNRFVNAWLPGSDSQDVIDSRLDVIKSRMAAKKPVVVCLYGGVSHGHHVLAIGVEPTWKTLELYDSNHPGDVCTLSPNTDGKWYHSDGSVWNGWFTDGGYEQNGGAQLPVVPFKFCRDCHALVCTAFMTSGGLCSGGGPHNLMDTEYFLPMDSSTGEGGWFLCGHCLCMFSNDGATAGGWCGTGGKHEAKAGWPEMSVCHVGRGKGEMSWYQCSSCLTLNWGGGAPAKCPAGGNHDNTGSAKYICDNRFVPKPQ